MEVWDRESDRSSEDVGQVRDSRYGQSSLTLAANYRAKFSQE